MHHFLQTIVFGIYYSVGFFNDSAQLYLNDSLIQSRTLNTDYSVSIAGYVNVRVRKQDTLKLVCKQHVTKFTRKDRYAFIAMEDNGLAISYYNSIYGLD